MFAIVFLRINKLKIYFVHTARSIRLPKSKPVSLSPVDLPKEEDKSNTIAATATQPSKANEKKVSNKKKAKESNEEKSKPSNAGNTDFLVHFLILFAWFKKNELK